jgi:hypothetical protein
VKRDFDAPSFALKGAGFGVSSLGIPNETELIL